MLTTGNVVIPNAAGDVGIGDIILGGAHTITFNSTVTAVLAGGCLACYVRHDGAAAQLADGRRPPAMT